VGKEHREESFLRLRSSSDYMKWTLCLGPHHANHVDNLFGFKSGFSRGVKALKKFQEENCQSKTTTDTPEFIGVKVVPEADLKKTFWILGTDSVPASLIDSELYTNYNKAREAVIAIAKKHPNHVFHILRAVEYFQAETTKIKSKIL